MYDIDWMGIILSGFEFAIESMGILITVTGNFFMELFKQNPLQALLFTGLFAAGLFIPNKRKRR